MKVLVACEFSGIVRTAFAERGHDAWSCDILPTDLPGQHIQDNVLFHLHRDWDLIVAHPPCTYLSVAGVQYMKDPKRQVECMKAAFLFNQILGAPAKMIAIENPVQHRFARQYIRKYDQLVRINQFGAPAYKPTCFWLKNLPALKPTGEVAVEVVKYPNGKTMSKWYQECKGNAKTRSKTFPQVALAMAEQWGEVR